MRRPWPTGGCWAKRKKVLYKAYSKLATSFFLPRAKYLPENFVKIIVNFAILSK
jgi:hypothetical protein